jgi:sarcosine oxidase
MGLNTATSLWGRGHEPVIFDPLPPDHTRGSSHGRSRIVRRAYPDAKYTRWMLEGYDLWHRLERLTGVQLLHEVGLLYFGDRDDHDIVNVANSLAELEVSHEIYASKTCKHALPQFNFGSNEVGIFTAEAGFVNADHVRTTLYQFLQSKDISIVQERRRLDQDWNSFDAVLVCAGPWIRDWVSLPVTVNLQTVGYFPVHQHGPVWIEQSPDFLYGFPTEAWGLKVGVHRPGPTISPHDDSRNPEPAAASILEAFSKRRFTEPATVGVQVACLYTVAPNDDFLFGEIEHPECRIFYASPCSGHGFKFGPWIGERMADFAEGKLQPEQLV